VLQIVFKYVPVKRLQTMSEMFCGTHDEVCLLHDSHLRRLERESVVVSVWDIVVTIIIIAQERV